MHNAKNWTILYSEVLTSLKFNFQASTTSFLFVIVLLKFLFFWNTKQWLLLSFIRKNDIEIHFMTSNCFKKKADRKSCGQNIRDTFIRMEEKANHVKLLINYFIWRQTLLQLTERVENNVNSEVWGTRTRWITHVNFPSLGSVSEKLIIKR